MGEGESPVLHPKKSRAVGSTEEKTGTRTQGSSKLLRTPQCKSKTGEETQLPSRSKRLEPL